MKKLFFAMLALVVLSASPASAQMTNQAGILLTRRPIADAAATVANTDYLLAYTVLTASRAVTLPSATAVPNQYFIIKDESGNAGTYNLTFAATIDGATGKTINAAYGEIRVYSNGSAWFSW
jgi:hypothetical protein